MAPTVLHLTGDAIPPEMRTRMRRGVLSSTRVGEAKYGGLPRIMSYDCTTYIAKKKDIPCHTTRLGLPLFFIRDATYEAVNPSAQLENAKREWTTTVSEMRAPLYAGLEANQNLITKILSSTSGKALTSHYSNIFLVCADYKHLDFYPVHAMWLFITQHSLLTDHTTEQLRIIWEKMTPDNFLAFWNLSKANPYLDHFRRSSS